MEYWLHQIHIILEITSELPQSEAGFYERCTTPCTVPGTVQAVQREKLPGRPLVDTPSSPNCSRSPSLVGDAPLASGRGGDGFAVRGDATSDFEVRGELASDFELVGVKSEVYSPLTSS